MCRRHVSFLFIKVHGASPLRLLVLVSARLFGGSELASRACAVTAVFKRLSTAASALVCVTCVDDHNLFCRVNGAAGGSESLECATQGKFTVSKFTCGRNKTWAELDLPDFSYAGMAIGDRYDDKPDTKGWKVAGLELARHIWPPLSRSSLQSCKTAPLLSPLTIASTSTPTGLILLRDKCLAGL